MQKTRRKSIKNSMQEFGSYTSAQDQTNTQCRHSSKNLKKMFKKLRKINEKIQNNVA